MNKSDTIKKAKKKITPLKAYQTHLDGKKVVVYAVDAIEAKKLIDLLQNTK